MIGSASLEQRESLQSLDGRTTINRPMHAARRQDETARCVHDCEIDVVTAFHHLSARYLDEERLRRG